MRRSPLRTAGFSLAELLLALLLLSVGVLALIGVFTSGLNLMSRSEEVTAATQIARNLLERTRAMDPAKVPQSSEFDGTVAADLNGFPPAPYPAIERNGRRYEVQVKTKPQGPHTVSVSVTVRWQDGGPLTCETYLAKSTQASP